MAKSATTPTIVSVSRQGLVLCGTNIKGVAKMPFADKLIQDLQITDLAKLSAEVASFVQNNRIKPSDLVMVMDKEVYFAKELTGADDAELTNQTQAFTDSVPLANPSSKLFKIKDKYHVIVIDRRLYESIRSAFAQLGFGILAVVPDMLLGTVGVGSNFDALACRTILHHLDFIKENSFVGEYPRIAEDSWVKKNKTPATVLSLIAITAALSGTAFIVWQTLQYKKTAIARARARQQAQLQKPSPEPTLIPTPTSAADLTTYSVTVLNGSGTAGAAGRMKENLSKAGFGQIDIGNTAVSAKTVIVFTPRVPLTVRDNVSLLVRQTYTQVQTVENAQAQSDILITLGKNTP